MLNFNMGALRHWRSISTGELLDFDVQQSGPRSVAFDIIADAVVSVSVISTDDAWLVAYGSGELSVKFSTDVPCAVVVNGDPSANVFIRTFVQTQVVPESLDPSFTSIEPRRAGPSDEIRRLMHLQQLNARRREQVLLDELARLNQRAQVIEPAPSPAPSPAPAPVDGGGDAA